METERDELVWASLASAAAQLMLEGRRADLPLGVYQVNFGTGPVLCLNDS